MCWSLEVKKQCSTVAISSAGELEVDIFSTFRKLPSVCSSRILRVLKRHIVHKEMLRNSLCHIAENGNLAKLETVVEYDGFIAYLIEK
jgi:hypothetical protein